MALCPLPLIPPVMDTRTYGCRYLGRDGTHTKSGRHTSQFGSSWSLMYSLSWTRPRVRGDSGKNEKTKAPRFIGEKRVRAYGFVSSMRAVCRFYGQESTKIGIYERFEAIWRSNGAVRLLSVAAKCVSSHRSKQLLPRSLSLTCACPGSPAVRCGMLLPH